MTTCTVCNDTGKLPGSDYLDCSCGAAQERAAMDTAAREYVQAYEGDLQYAPEDVRWFVHQRARQIEREAQAERIAELERQLEEAEDLIAQTSHGAAARIAELERALRSAHHLLANTEGLSKNNIEQLAWEEAEAIAAVLGAAPSAPAVEQQIKLDSIEQYRQQMAGISTAALGYWKEGDSIHPDYDTIALRDVAKLYAKYDALYKAAEAAAPQAADTDKVREETLTRIENMLIEIRRGEFASNFIPYLESWKASLSSMAAQAPVREVPEGWIACSDRLPAPYQTVALLNENRWMNTGNDDFDTNWHGAGWLAEFGQKYWSVIGETRSMTLESVTHWMPLPAAPVQQEGGRG